MAKTVGNTVVVIDGGGRGSALVHKYAQSKKVSKIIAIPGNDLMQANTPKPIETHPALRTTSVEEIITICKKNKVALVDVAQDNAIEAGLVDRLVEAGIPTVGPTKLAGQIEWDKAWSREFGRRHDLPQPVFKVCRSLDEGVEYIENRPEQAYFIKAAGLAEGKGVLPAKNKADARQKIAEMVRFGKAGENFLIENWLQGDDGVAEEFSLFILTDGTNSSIIGYAQDHKRVDNHDEGPNTGGMGCNAPPAILTPDMLQEIDTKIIKKVIKGLAQEDRPYKGILYLGGMLISEKAKLEPYVIEFNARWGDPEAQCLVPGIKNDLFELGCAVSKGDISSLKISRDQKYRIAVAAVSRGYPDDYSSVRGKQIYGLELAKKLKGITIYGAGVQKKSQKYYAAGGRLFYIISEGQTNIEARQRAYGALALIYIDGNNLHYRTDIGHRDTADYYS